jgi:hypothetical protein
MSQGTRRFTLVELMIVVAIVMVLAAIAVPAFATMQLRSKRAELPGIVSGMKVANIAYEAAFDLYYPSTGVPWPTSAIGKKARPWVTGSPFVGLGYAPDGEVRGTYTIEDPCDCFFAFCPIPCTEKFGIGGVCDVDGNGVTYTVGATASAMYDDLSPATSY